MDNQKENKMGTQPVLRLILSMSLPAMFSMLIQALYNVVDSIFVAKIGENALTAVSLAFPIQTLMIAVAVGTGIGINSLIARRLGEKRQEEADQAANHGIFLGLVSGLAFALFGALFTKMFLRGFTADPEVYSYGCSYLYIVTIFSFGSFVHINVEKTLQATGNMIYPMIMQLLGAVINIILDPILIFGLLGFPAMGVRGAAIATVIGQMLSMGLGLVLLVTKDHAVHIKITRFHIKGAVIKEIYAVGFPSIIMQSITSVLVMFLNGILSRFSGAAVSVLGVYFKLQSFVFMPVFGLNQGMMPIMGYNYGARNKKRLMDTLKYGMVIALLIMALGTLLFHFLPAQLLGMFSASEEMLSIGVPALRIISLSFLFAAVGIIFSNLFQAIGKGIYSLSISVLRQLVIILPVAFVMANTVGLIGIWFAFPIAEAFSVIASVVLFLLAYRSQIRGLEVK